MLELYKLLVILLVVIIVYIEPLMKKNPEVISTNVPTSEGPSTTHHTEYNVSKRNGIHERHKREALDKSLVFYFENRERLKKIFPKLFEELHKKFLTNTCPDTVKLTDNERLGECLMEQIEEEIHNIYDQQREKLEEAFSFGNLPSFFKKLKPEQKTLGIAQGDVPIFHKLLKYRYFKKFDQFHLDFFHYLPLVIKNEIRNYYMYKFKGGYDVFIHERIHYLEEKVDEWILRCANHTRMGSLSQDALYEEEFLHELSLTVGEEHLLYEVTEMHDIKDPEKENNKMLVY